MYICIYVYIYIYICTPLSITASQHFPYHSNSSVIRSYVLQVILNNLINNNLMIKLCSSSNFK